MRSSWWTILVVVAAAALFSAGTIGATTQEIPVADTWVDEPAILAAPPLPDSLYTQPPKSLEELRQAVIEGAVHRLRPKLLTEGVAIVAIAPMLFATGVGSEIISAMALPVLGGLLIADEVVDIFLPVRFYWVRRARWLKLQKEREEAAKERAAKEGEKTVQEEPQLNGQPGAVLVPTF